MPRFRLLAGKHTQREQGKLKTYKAGDVFDSPHELDKMFDQPGFGKKKFEKVEETTPITTTSNQLGSQHQAPSKSAADTLRSMTIDELRKLAQSEEIDLRGAKSKEEVIKVIEQATTVVASK